eukprot:scaffold3189_cov166-Amphora_coffeaeformis.AAC.1
METLYAAEAFRCWVCVARDLQADARFLGGELATKPHQKDVRTHNKQQKRVCDTTLEKLIISSATSVAEQIPTTGRGFFFFGFFHRCFCRGVSAATSAAAVG